MISKEDINNNKEENNISNNKNNNKCYCFSTPSVSAPATPIQHRRLFHSAKCWSNSENSENSQLLSAQQLHRRWNVKCTLCRPVRLLAPLCIAQCATVSLCHCAAVHCAPVGATVANGASDSSASSVHTVPRSRKGLAHFSFKTCFFYFFNHTSKLKPLWMAGIGIIFALLTFDFHVSDKNRFLFSVDGVAGKMREGCWWPKSWTLRQVRTDFVFVGAPTKKIILSCVAISRLSWVTVFRFGAKY